MPAQAKIPNTPGSPCCGIKIQAAFLFMWPLQGLAFAQRSSKNNSGHQKESGKNPLTNSRQWSEWGTEITNNLMNEINRERFEAWLFSQPKERVIEAGSRTKCFICSFIKETTRNNDPYVNLDQWTHDYCANPRKPIPAWASRLISPEWCRAKSVEPCSFWPIKAGDMQHRYLELFPEMVIEEAAPQEKVSA